LARWDVVTTGTRRGGAIGMKLPLWLKAADAMTFRMEGLAVQTSKVVAFKE